MLRVSNICSRTDRAEPPQAIVVQAATPTVVLQDLIQPQVPNINTQQGLEIVGRYIFNDTGAKLWYAMGTDKCDNNLTYHGVLADQQQLDVSNCSSEVSVYSVAGGKVTVTIIHRQDLHTHGIIQQSSAPDGN